MITFDLAERQSEGVVLGRKLPAGLAEQLLRNGVDTSKPLRIVGMIAQRPSGAPGPYLVRFERA